MSQFYYTIAITRLSDTVAQLPLMKELLSPPITFDGAAVLDHFMYESTWVTTESSQRFQVHGMSMSPFWLFRAHKGWHLAYEELMRRFVRMARPMIWMNNWNTGSGGCLSYHEVLRPVRGEREHYPSGSPFRGDEHERASDLKLASGLEPEAAARLTAEELHFIIQCRRLPLRALVEHRLVDLAGWVVYLGPELVTTYGEERLLSIRGSDICQDERGGVFLYLLSSVSQIEYRPGVTRWLSYEVFREAREVLGIDASWFVRYNELEAKARGLPWSPANFHF